MLKIYNKLEKEEIKRFQSLRSRAKGTVESNFIDVGFLANILEQYAQLKLERLVRFQPYDK